MIQNPSFPLPDHLPVPIDDGAADHLPGISIPPLPLPSTAGEQVDLSQRRGRVVVYCYPKTGVPGVPLPEGWDEIPGARGCTPQSCAYRDHYREIRELGAEVYGLSSQNSDYQREMAERLQLPFGILSDAELRFSRALRLPTFTVGGEILLKRITLIIRHRVIETVRYPVFPSNSDSAWVIDILKKSPI